MQSQSFAARDVGQLLDVDWTASAPTRCSQCLNFQDESNCTNCMGKEHTLVDVNGVCMPSISGHSSPFHHYNPKVVTAPLYPQSTTTRKSFCRASFQIRKIPKNVKKHGRNDNMHEDYYMQMYSYIYTHTYIHTHRTYLLNI